MASRTKVNKTQVFDDKLKDCALGFFGGNTTFNQLKQNLIHYLSNGANPNQKIEDILLIRYLVTDKKTYGLSAYYLNIMNTLFNFKHYEIDIYERDKTGQSLLETMVKKPQYFDLFEFIFKYYEKHNVASLYKLISYKDKHGNNLILLSMFHGENCKVIETIFKHGYTVSFFETNKFNNSPFKMALKLKYFTFTEFMIKKSSLEQRTKILKEYPLLFNIAITNVQHSLFCHLLYRTNLILHDCRTNLNQLIDGYICGIFIEEKESTQQKNRENILICYLQYISECMPGKFETEEISSNINIELAKSNIPTDISNMIIYYTVGDEEYSSTLLRNYEFNQYILADLLKAFHTMYLSPFILDLNIKEIYNTYTL